MQLNTISLKYNYFTISTPLFTAMFSEGMWFTGFTSILHVTRRINSLKSDHERFRVIKSHRECTMERTVEPPIKVCVSAHVALRTLLALSQPVNCIFWPIGMLKWLFAASKLHKHRGTCCTAEWPYCPFTILWRKFRMTLCDFSSSLLLYIDFKDSKKRNRRQSIISYSPARRAWITTKYSKVTKTKIRCSNLAFKFSRGPCLQTL